ncbi:hypothetical protein [Pseudomonas sp. LAIL14HWK12:I11]|uniref:hypothetical protein n=2 Tax=Pseudomonas TaxID=286 RepID=UPI00117BD17C|nr:hypothetical protein [Pseudomonas sp. LAIL14HWK12:I11]
MDSLVTLAASRNDTGTRREADARRERLNLPTLGMGTAVTDKASRRPSRLWPRLRLGALVPLVLGACMLLPATSSELQAKELSMQDNQGQYQPYIPGMKLPEGVFPPMKGYTHEDLIGAAALPVEAVMKAEGIDPTLIKESLFALAKHLNEALEAQNVEYQISTWYQKPYDNPADRTKSVAAMGESFGALAIRAAGQSLRGSPLLNLGEAFFERYTRSAGDGVHDLIVTLNKPGA